MKKAILETPFGKGGPGSGRKKGPQVEYGKYKGRFPIRRKQSGEETEASKRSRKFDLHEWLKLLPDEEGSPERSSRPEKPQLFGYHGARKSFSEEVFEKSEDGQKKESWQVGGQHPHIAHRRKTLPQAVKDAMKFSKNKDAGVIPRKKFDQSVLSLFGKTPKSAKANVKRQQTKARKMDEIERKYFPRRTLASIHAEEDRLYREGKRGVLPPRRTLGDVVLGVARGMHPRKEKFETPKGGSTPSKAEKDFSEIREWQRNK